MSNRNSRYGIAHIAWKDKAGGIRSGNRGVDRPVSAREYPQWKLYTGSLFVPPFFNLTLPIVSARHGSRRANTYAQILLRCHMRHTPSCCSHFARRMVDAQHGPTVSMILDIRFSRCLILRGHFIIGSSSTCLPLVSFTIHTETLVTLHIIHTHPIY